MAAPPPEQPPDNGEDDQPAGSPDDADRPAGAVTVAAIATALRPVIREGIDDNDPATYRALLGLDCVRRRALDAGYPVDDDGLTHAAQDVVREALDSLEGPFGEAARRLFGAHTDAHGQPPAERRRQGAYQLGLMQTHFRRHREPKIRREIASHIYRAEHAPSDPQSEPAASDDDRARVADATEADTGIAHVVTPDTVHAHATGPDRPAGEGSDDGPAGRARRARDSLWPWRRLAELDEVPTVVVASASTPHALTQGSQPRQLLRQLQQLRDEHARREWYIIFALLGGLCVWTWGWDAAPLYVLGLASLGLVKTLVEIGWEWRATKTVAVYERWPRLLLLFMIAAIAGIVATQPDDTDERAAAACTQAAQDLGQCDDPATTTPATTSPSPNSVPVTYAQPTPPAPPDCPPAGNQQRRLVFTAPPPLCIDPDAAHVATITTNYGTFELTLNTQDALWAVNNFVFLARWHHYDGVTLEPWPAPGITFNPPTPQPGDNTGPYDGLDYTTPRYLTSRQPIEPGTIPFPVPGYSLTFDAPPTSYPDKRELYAIPYTSEQPHLFAIVISPEAHDEIAQDATTPVLGTITQCRDLLATGSPEERTPAVTGTPMVITSIEITEHRQPPTNTTAYQDHCAEDHARTTD